MKGIVTGVSAAVGGVLAFLLLLVLPIMGGSDDAAAACTTSGAGVVAVAGGSGSAGQVAIGTLNWRGASHYKKDPHHGEQPYTVRVPYMVDALDSSGSTVVGFQEFETPQKRAFLKQTAGSWALVQGTAYGKADSRDAIAYQPAVWAPTQVKLVPIKYDAGTVEIPFVRLRSLSTPGLAVWVLNTHNPANVVSGNDSIRSSDVNRELAAIAAVASAEPSAPIFFVGDMNETQPFARQFLAGATGWSTANPVGSGSVGWGGHIDWIMGSPGVTWSQTVTDTSTNDGAHHYTDHPFVHTVAAVPGSSDASSAGAAPTNAAAGTGTAGEVQASGATTVPGFTSDQIANAAAVIAAGKGLNVPPRGIAIGLMTAYGESKLHNIATGDRDSIGLFQQRGNGAWGTTADRMDPTTAAANFFKKLLTVPGWEGMDPTLAAHAVQVNADPYYYQPYWKTGLKLYGALAGTAAAATADPSTVDCTTPSAGASDVSFTDSGTAYVGPYAPDELMARAQAFVQAGTRDPFFGTVNGSWYRKCQHFVANLSGRSQSGFDTAADGWSHYVAIGAAHPATAADGQSPPPGAWLYFKGSSAAGHVTVYLGNGLSASTDLPTEGRVGIVPATAPITTWHQTYLGWAAPWGAAGTGSQGGQP